MSPAEENRDSSWIQRVLSNRTCLRAWGFGVAITSFIICMVGFVLAILAYKKILPETWVPVGPSCGVPASCVCTFTFVYLLFCWKEDDAITIDTDQDRIERSEPNDEISLLASTEFPTEERICEETPSLRKLAANLVEVFASANVHSNSEESTSVLTDSNAECYFSIEYADFTESTERSKPVDKKFEKQDVKPEETEGKYVVFYSLTASVEECEAKLQCGTSVSSGLSEVSDKPESVDDGKAKHPSGTSEASGESIAVIDEPKSTDYTIKLQCRIPGKSAVYLETKLPLERSTSSEVSFKSKDSDSTST